MRRLARFTAYALLLTAVVDAGARADELTLRGFVRDKIAGSPVSGARVSVVGARHRADQVTDDGGFFHLALPGLTGGSVVRLRVEKDGYKVVDRNVSASEELPLDVAVTPSKTGLARKLDVAPTITAAFLEQQKSADQQMRSAAATAFGRRGIADAVAVRAIATALQDPAFPVRIDALDAVADGKLLAPTLLPVIAARFWDPAPEVALRALSVVKLFGKRARSVTPELLAVFGRVGQRSEAVREVTVRSLLALGEYDDPRLQRALVSTLLVGRRSSASEDLFASAQGHPELLLSQLPRLAQILTAPTEEKNCEEQRAAIAILVAAGAPGRKVLAAKARREQRLGTLERLPYLLAWILEDPRAARDEISRAIPLGALLTELGGLLGTDGATVEPLLLADGRSTKVPARVLAAIALEAMGSDAGGGAGKALEDALREGFRSDGTALLLRTLPALPAAERTRLLATGVELLSHCPAKPSPACAYDFILDDFASALSTFGDAGLQPGLSSLSNHPRTEVSAVAEKALAGIRTRLGLPTPAPAVSD